MPVSRSATCNKAESCGHTQEFVDVVASVREREAKRLQRTRRGVGRAGPQTPLHRHMTHGTCACRCSGWPGSNQQLTHKYFRYKMVCKSQKSRHADRRSGNISSNMVTSPNASSALVFSLASLGEWWIHVHEHSALGPNTYLTGLRVLASERRLRTRPTFNVQRSTRRRPDYRARQTSEHARAGYASFV